MNAVELAEANLRIFCEEIDRMGYGSCSTQGILESELERAKMKAALDA